MKHIVQYNYPRLDGVYVQIGICLILDLINHCPDQLTDSHDVRHLLQVLVTYLDCYDHNSLMQDSGAVRYW